MSTLKKILKLIKPYRFAVALTVLLSAASVVTSLLIPILIGRGVDLILGAGRVDFERLMPILAEVAVLACATGVLQWVIGAVNNRVSFGTVHRLRDMAFERLQRLPLSYLDSHSQGDTVSRIITDADQVADGLLLGFSQLFTGAATILGTLIFMLRLHAGIALIVVLVTPVSIVVSRFIAKNTFDMFRMQSQVRGEQTAFTDEAVDGMKVIRAFSRENAAMERFDEINGRLEKYSLRATFFSSMVNPSTRLINNIVYLLVCLVGGASVIGGGLTVGALTGLLSYATQYARPFNDISGVITEFQNALACAARLFELIEQPDEPADGDGELNASGEVSLSHVRFSYSPEKPLIRDLSLEVSPGMRVAIVGPTGCGKTTLINLLMRFYDVQGGVIRAGGDDIRTLSRRSLRRGFGMVLQDTWLKSGTIRDNIVIGKPEASDEEVIAAAKAAHAHSFIRRLPNGYDTVITEGGDGLSQGQKQLLCITRVMLAPPPMLILDEATSSIDTRTEHRIQSAFARLTAGRTSFIVAHRLSTVKNADLILVMRDGDIIETGNHETLMQKGGFYAVLYNSQFDTEV